MAQTLSKNELQEIGLNDNNDLPLSITIEASNFLANGHPILTKVPTNIVATQSDAKTQVGCFLGFEADQPRSRHVVPIGKLSGIKFMSIFRFKIWWSTHWSGNSGKDVEIETQIMVLDKNHSGRPYVLLLPLIEGPFRSSLQSGEKHDDYVDICVESGSSLVCGSSFKGCLYVHVGHDPYRLIRDAMRVVRAHLGTFRLLEEKTPPSIVDKFGWCTWDAFYSEVDPKGVREGVKVLKEGGCPPRWVLIDDGWQSFCYDEQDPNDEIKMGSDKNNENPRLTSFGENYKFRNYESHRVPLGKGMGGFVRDLKEEFGTVEEVYVWHALVAYWGGIRPDAPGMPESKVVTPRLSEGLKKSMEDLAVRKIMGNGIGLVHPEKAHLLYEGLHSHLASAGINGVKIDVIHCLEMMAEEYGGQVELAKAYYKALTDSLNKYFNGNDVISSMQQGNDFMFLGTQSISLGRVGDDFWVTDPGGDESGRYWLQGCHMVHCAYNSLWMCNFIHPDWDMFQTTHPLAHFHAVARSISGGPVYVSDRVGTHDFELLRRLVLPDGSILRCESYAYPTRDCLFDDPLHDGETVLKIWNLNKYTGVLGLFNCQGGGWCNTTRRNKAFSNFKAKLRTSISPLDIEWNNGKNPISVSGTNTFAVFFSRENQLRLMKFTEKLQFSLDPLHCELLTVSPVCALPGKPVQFAPIGLANMFNPGAAIRSMEVDQCGISVRVRVKGCGEMRVFASEKPGSCRIDGVGVEFCYGDHMVSVQVPWSDSCTLSVVEYLF